MVQRRRMRYYLKLIATEVCKVTGAKVLPRREQVTKIRYQSY